MESCENSEDPPRAHLLSDAKTEIEIEIDETEIGMQIEADDKNATDEMTNNDHHHLSSAEQR